MVALENEIFSFFSVSSWQSKANLKKKKKRQSECCYSAADDRSWQAGSPVTQKLGQIYLGSFKWCFALEVSITLLVANKTDQGQQLGIFQQNFFP